MQDTIRRDYDYIGEMLAFEIGDLDEDGVVTLFQYLVDTGMVWAMQGSYGRTAAALIEAGLVTKGA